MVASTGSSAVEKIRDISGAAWEGAKSAGNAAQNAMGDTLDDIGDRAGAAASVITKSVDDAKRSTGAVWAKVKKKI